jgi:pyridoxal phosphate enzyme (YggS family)
VSIAQNLERLRNDIADACAHADRSTDSVALMAVSKTHPAEVLQEAFAAGQRLFGENRVQEWQAKRATLSSASAPAATIPPAVTIPYAATIPDALEMHLIGPLQSNKSARAAELFSAIDTVDSLKLATRLDTAAAALQRVLPVLLEVKLSPEEAKHGAAPEALASLLEGLRSLKHIEARGLMTVPPYFADASDARPYFTQLRALRDRFSPLYPALAQLSMGMSHDFRIAIEEGSTCVRLGTAIFGRRE